MKKFLSIAIFAISMASCSTTTTETAPATDSATVINDSAKCNDTCTITAEKAPAAAPVNQ